VLIWYSNLATRKSNHIYNFFNII